jgi:hypothetical protein
MFWKTFWPTFAAVTALVFGARAFAADPPSMATGSLPDTRSHAECLEYAASVMRVLDISHIRTTTWSVYGQSIREGNGISSNAVIRCETDAKRVFFAVAGGGADDGDKVEGMVQILMRQFEITKNLRKCDPRHPTPLQLCQ